MTRFLPLALGLALNLAACASAPPIATPVELKVPVAVPCHIDDVPEPAWPLARLRPTDDIATKTRALLAELDTRMAYEDELKAAITGCS